MGRAAGRAEAEGVDPGPRRPAGSDPLGEGSEQGISLLGSIA